MDIAVGTRPEHPIRSAAFARIGIDIDFDDGVAHLHLYALAPRTAALGVVARFKFVQLFHCSFQFGCVCVRPETRLAVVPDEGPVHDRRQEFEGEAVERDSGAKWRLDKQRRPSEAEAQVRNRATVEPGFSARFPRKMEAPACQWPKGPWILGMAHFWSGSTEPYSALPIPFPVCPSRSRAFPCVHFLRHP